jgi:AbiV family abortive infection protein
LKKTTPEILNLHDNRRQTRGSKMRGKKKDREIPRAKIQEGVNLCKKNIFSFLNTAESLLESDNLNHAAINVEFAIEEFGKILILKDEYGKGTDPVQVPDDVFTSPKHKPERAWKIGDPYALDSKYKMISNGGFERNDNGKQGFSRGFSQQHTRLHAVRRLRR